MAEDTLTGGGVGVGVDESADGGVVITGLEVIEPGFGWALLRTRRGCPPPGRCFSVCTCRKR